MSKSYTYRELERKLRKYDQRFEFHVRQGKGSHRMIFHADIDGHPVSYPVKYHGRKTTMLPYVLNDLRKRFKLPDDFWE